MGTGSLDYNSHEISQEKFKGTAVHSSEAAAVASHYIVKQVQFHFDFA